MTIEVWVRSSPTTVSIKWKFSSSKLLKPLQKQKFHVVMLVFSKRKRQMSKDDDLRPTYWVSDLWKTRSVMVQLSGLLRHKKCKIITPTQNNPHRVNQLVSAVCEVDRLCVCVGGPWHLTQSNPVTEIPEWVKHWQTRPTRRSANVTSQARRHRERLYWRMQMNFADEYKKWGRMSCRWP